MSKILVVDDEAIITMQLEERLSVMGYTVAGMAASGEDAVDKARRTRPDLVLMDIVMPGKMNGIEAAKIITKELDIPVVFVTAYADDAIIERAKSARPYGYIVKPFNELEI
jgi:CheY-like chemotaxis protein